MTAEEIKELRKRSGLTKSRFAALLKVADRTVSSLEQSESRPSKVVVKRLQRIKRRFKEGSKWGGCDEI